MSSSYLHHTVPWPSIQSQFSFVYNSAVYFSKALLCYSSFYTSKIMFAFPCMILILHLFTAPSKTKTTCLALLYTLVDYINLFRPLKPIPSKSNSTLYRQKNLNYNYRFNSYCTVKILSLCEITRFHCSLPKFCLLGCYAA